MAPRWEGWAVSWAPTVGSRIADSVGPFPSSLFSSLCVPALSSDPKAFPFTINMETWLFAWVYFPSFVDYLVPQNCAFMKEACGAPGAWSVTQAPIKPNKAQVEKLNKGCVSFLTAGTCDWCTDSGVKTWMAPSFSSAHPNQMVVFVPRGNGQ